MHGRSWKFIIHWIFSFPREAIFCSWMSGLASIFLMKVKSLCLKQVLFYQLYKCRTLPYPLWSGSDFQKWLFFNCLYWTTRRSINKICSHVHYNRLVLLKGNYQLNSCWIKTNLKFEWNHNCATHLDSFFQSHPFPWMTFILPLHRGFLLLLEKVKRTMFLKYFLFL